MVQDSPFFDYLPWIFTLPYMNCMTQLLKISYQMCRGLMLLEDYRALTAIVVEPGRAHLNNFSSGKLESCHHCIIGSSKGFSSFRFEPIADLGSWIWICYWQQRWVNSWEFWCQSTLCDLYTSGGVEGWTRMPSPHGDAPVALEKNAIDPKNPFVHNLHLGALQVRDAIRNT